MYNSKIREICYAYAIANKMALPLSVEDSFNAVALWVEDTVTGMAPYVGANNHWYVYDKETQTFKDSGVEATGDKGDTGATPNIQITATVSQNTGTPSVNVEKNGTPENPLFKLVFDGIKGEAGRDVLMLPVLGSVITEGTELAFANTNFNRTPNVGDTGYVISVRDLTIYIAEFTIIPNGETIGDDFSTVKYGRVKSITLSDINYMGLWVGNSDYHVNDIVTYHGSSYICIENISNSISNDTPNFDTTHWAIFASGGDSQHFARANVIGDLNIGDEIPIVNVTPENPMIGDGIIALGNRRAVNTTPAGTWLILGKVTRLGGTSTSATMEVITYIDVKGEQGEQGQTALEYSNIVTYASTPTTASVTLAQVEFNRDPVPHDSFIAMASATDTGTLYMCTFVVDSLSATDAICHATNWRPIASSKLYKHEISLIPSASYPSVGEWFTDGMTIEYDTMTSPVAITQRYGLSKAVDYGKIVVEIISNDETPYDNNSLLQKLKKDGKLKVKFGETINNIPFEFEGYFVYEESGGRDTFVFEANNSSKLVVDKTGDTQYVYFIRGFMNNSFSEFESVVDNVSELK